jgi:hypothetical protein
MSKTHTCGSKTLRFVSETRDRIVAECYVCLQPVVIYKGRHSKKELAAIKLQIKDTPKVVQYA